MCASSDMHVPTLSALRDRMVALSENPGIDISPSLSRCPLLARRIPTHGRRTVPSRTSPGTCWTPYSWTRLRWISSAYNAATTLRVLFFDSRVPRSSKAKNHSRPAILNRLARRMTLFTESCSRKSGSVLDVSMGISGATFCPRERNTSLPISVN